MHRGGGEMAEREPIMTKTMKLTDTRQHFSEVLNEVFRGQSRVLVEKSGIPVAGIVSAHDLVRLQALEAKREEAFKALDRFGEVFKDESPEDIEREVAKAVAA